MHVVFRQEVRVPGSGKGGGVMADLVEYELDDGSRVLFESDEASLVSLHGGDPDVKEGGPLADRLSSIAKTAGQVAAAMRKNVGPDELALELGVKVAGELNAWFFAKQQAEATIKVTLTWKKPAETP
jgi:Trypsin-co-occurring domain 1